jgi:ubiquinone/menaquinone biosynthesis C-methylase UbiE
MLTEAQKLARALGLGHTAFVQGDAEALPLAPHAFDLVTCKLAFHYFPHPQVALAEMVRVATGTACLMLVDRVSPEDSEKHAYQNRVEKLRTPSKAYVYSESQLVAALEQTGLVVEQQARHLEQMGVDDWIRAAGPDEQTAHTIRALLMAEGDPAGLDIRHEGDRLVMTHQTCILVTRRR